MQPSENIALYFHVSVLALGSASASASQASCHSCRYLYALLAVTIGAYLGATGLIAVLFFFFNPSGPDCSFNITAIVATLLIALVMSALSMSVYVSSSH